MAFIASDSQADEVAPFIASPDQADEVGPQQGNIEAAGRGALRNFPLAQQAVAAIEPGQYSQNIQDLTQKAEQAKAQHLLAYGAGATAGTLAPLAIPGVGEAMEAAPALGNAALGATQAISDTNLAKNPGQALGQAAIGGGIGAGLGYAGHAAGKLLAPVGEEATNVANKYAVQATGIPAASLEGMSKDEINNLGSYIRQEMQSVGKPAIDQLELANGLKDKEAETLANISQYVQEAGNPGYDAVKVLEPISNAKDELGNLSNARAIALRNAYNKAEHDIVQLGDNPSFDQIQQLKGHYGELAFTSTGNIKDTAAAQVAKDVYTQLNKVQEDMADAVDKLPIFQIKGQTRPLSTEQFNQIKQGLLDSRANYSKLKDITNALLKASGKEAAGQEGTGGFGMVGRLLGKIPGFGGQHPALNMGAAAALTAAGHPMFGVGALTPLMMNPAAISNVTGSIPKVAGQTSAGLQQLLTNYFASKHAKGFADGGTAGLSQIDPSQLLQNLRAGKQHQLADIKSPDPISFSQDSPSDPSSGGSATNGLAGKLGTKLGQAIKGGAIVNPPTNTPTSMPGLDLSTPVAPSFIPTLPVATADQFADGGVVKDNSKKAPLVPRPQSTFIPHAGAQPLGFSQVVNTPKLTPQQVQAISDYLGQSAPKPSQAFIPGSQTSPLGFSQLPNQSIAPSQDIDNQLMNKAIHQKAEDELNQPVQTSTPTQEVELASPVEVPPDWHPAPVTVEAQRPSNFPIDVRLNDRKVDKSPEAVRQAISDFMNGTVPAKSPKGYAEGGELQNPDTNFFNLQGAPPPPPLPPWPSSSNQAPESTGSYHPLSSTGMTPELKEMQDEAIQRALTQSDTPYSQQPSATPSQFLKDLVNKIKDELTPAEVAKSTPTAKAPLQKKPNQAPPTSNEKYMKIYQKYLQDMYGDQKKKGYADGGNVEDPSLLGEAWNATGYPARGLEALGITGADLLTGKGLGPSLQEGSERIGSITQPGKEPTSTSGVVGNAIGATLDPRMIGAIASGSGLAAYLGKAAETVPEVAKVGEAVSPKAEQLAQWAKDVYGKPMEELSLQEIDKLNKAIQDLPTESRWNLTSPKEPPSQLDQYLDSDEPKGPRNLGAAANPKGDSFNPKDIPDAQYVGSQENNMPGGKTIDLYNITQPGHPQMGSTVSENTLREMGLEVPSKTPITGAQGESFGLDPKDIQSQIDSADKEISALRDMRDGATDELSQVKTDSFIKSAIDRRVKLQDALDYLTGPESPENPRGGAGAMSLSKNLTDMNTAELTAERNSLQNQIKTAFNAMDKAKGSEKAQLDKGLNFLVKKYGQILALLD